jgi:hypothetical protein
MKLDNLEFLIYSSHKTATQSIIGILNTNCISANHIHILENLNWTPVIFIENLHKYKKQHNKKLKIITVVRNPIDRLKSSFFQSFYDDYIKFLHYTPENTPIMKYNLHELFKLYKSKLSDTTLPGIKESLFELNDIFQVDIIKESTFKKFEQMYYYENDLIELYILRFDYIIRDTLKYLNKCLHLQLTELIKSNTTEQKIYFKKYNQFKKIQDKQSEEYIRNRYKTDLLFFTNFIKSYQLNRKNGRK